MTNEDLQAAYSSPEKGNVPPISEADARFVLTASDVNQRKWTVSADEYRIQFRDEDGMILEKVRGRDPLFRHLGRNAFLAKFDTVRAFQFTNEDFAVVKDWVGPATESEFKEMLSTTFHWALPLGLLFLVLGVVPLVRGVDLPRSIICVAAGSVSIAGWLLARVSSHRALFLLNALLQAIFVVGALYLTFTRPLEFGIGLIGRAFVILFCSFIAISSYRRYGDYATVVPDPVSLDLPPKIDA